MGNLSNQNIESFEPMGDFEPLPVGDYTAIITGSELKESKSNSNNKYISLKFEIAEGQYKGRIIFTNLNLFNSNQTAVEIAQRELASITMSCFGHLKNVSDSSDFHGKILKIRLGIKPAEGQYGPSNVIKKYISNNIVQEQPIQPTTQPKVWEMQ